MAVEMMKGLRATTTSVTPKPTAKHSLTINKLQGTAVTSLYSIDGRKISASSLNGMVSGKSQRLYVMQRPGAAASLVIDPN